MRKNTSQVNLSSASWAAKHGISKQNNGSMFLGLNPNLNIEDEYIENLLKQIHFMTMEVKLLKEKQQQSEGNSLWGVINRSSQPLVSNIVDSNQKYQNMKKIVDTDLNKNQYQNIRLGDHQTALIHKLNYLQKRISGLQGSKLQASILFMAKQGKMNEKLAEYQAKLKALLEEKQGQTKKNNQLHSQFDSLLLEVEKEKFATTNEAQKIKNDEEIQGIIEAQRIKEIGDVKNKIKQIKQTIESSLQFQRAKEDQANIRQNMNTIIKTLAVSQFELRKLESSIKLAIQQKQKDVLDRKRMMEQFQSLKIVLKELQSLNAARLSQEVGNRKRQSLEIQKGQLQTKKLEKYLQDIKKKLSRSQDSEKVLRQQIQHLQRDLLKMKERRQELNTQLNKLTLANDKQDTVLNNFRNEFRRVQDQYEKVAQSELASSIDLNEIESQVIALRERKQYLSETLNLKQTLNQTRIEELQKVVQKNQDVNETVKILMEKWDQIRSFSKM